MPNRQRLPYSIRAENLRIAIEQMRSTQKILPDFEHHDDTQFVTQDGDVVTDVDGDHVLIVLKMD
ncbi:hypothetical protein [Rhizobium grahamii]|uniref:Uncharacterized protein n=2 Tax=Rhizobium grahamii TaxID=1120045 RepID=S3HTD4_9HYPH|nr:hypothetical protein [Rhizobium grahamii]EPE96481.1 hypothetical protein RGCCGE502_20075 [Rhizobium grahamii CCGE 502]RDJ03280.1 hypothetical protein B5K06_30240 [Rhizobium grahamii]